MSKETFAEAIAYVRALDEQDQLALTAADALAAAVERRHVIAACEICGNTKGAFICDEAVALAEYRKIRAVRPPEARSARERAMK